MCVWRIFIVEDIWIVELKTVEYGIEWIWWTKLKWTKKHWKEISNKEKMDAQVYFETKFQI